MTLPNDDQPKRDNDNEETASPKEQASADESQGQGDAQQEEGGGDDEGAAGYEFSIVVGTSLGRKLIEQSEDEGLSVEQYMSELLAESVVFRAWELAERKIQMRGGNSQGNQQNPQHRGGGNNSNNSSNNNNRNKGGGGRNRRGGMSQSRYQNIMDDKATFLEYVRNQERKNNNR